MTIVAQRPPLKLVSGGLPLAIILWIASVSIPRDLPAQVQAETVVNALTLALDAPSFRTDDLLTTSIQVTAAAAGTVTIRLYDEVKESRNRVLLQSTEVEHPGGGAVVRVPFDAPYAGKAIYATAHQAGTDATDDASFVGDLHTFQHPRTEPADFTSWWASEKAKLAAVSPNWVETRLPDRDTPYSTAYKVTGSIGNGRNVTMWVAIPKAGPNSPAALTQATEFPAMIAFPAAGNTHNRYFETPFSGAERVGAISVSVNFHEDIVTGSNGPGASSGYVQLGVDRRETNYFLDGIKRCLQAVNYVKQHPRFNGGDIMAYGQSQGGGLAKIVAGLYPDDIDLVMSQHDALSTHGARPTHAEGWPQWVSNFASSFEEVAYFDATFHTRRIKARMMFSNTGCMDDVVAPTSALTSFNQYVVHDATKVILISEDRDHATVDAYRQGYLDFARLNLDGAIPPVAPGEPAYDNREITIARSGASLSATYVKAGDAQPLAPGVGKWVKLVGPGEVTFTDPSAATTRFAVSSGTEDNYTVAFVIEEVASYGEVYVTSGIYSLAALSKPLPVTLTSFTAEALEHPSGRTDNRTFLAWSTAAERDNAAFDVQRSADGEAWATIGVVAGRGTTTERSDYTLTDAAPLPRTNYYRLRQRDRDGAAVFSSVVAVRFGTDRPSLTGVRVYPIPSSGYVNVTGLPTVAAGPVGTAFTLLDAAGRVVVLSPREVGAGLSPSSIRVDLTGVAPGAYLLRIRRGSETADRWIVVE